MLSMQQIEDHLAHKSLLVGHFSVEETEDERINIKIKDNDDRQLANYIVTGDDFDNDVDKPLQKIIDSLIYPNDQSRNKKTNILKAYVSKKKIKPAVGKIKTSVFQNKACRIELVNNKGVRYYSEVIPENINIDDNILDKYFDRIMAFADGLKKPEKQVSKKNQNFYQEEDELPDDFSWEEEWQADDEELFSLGMSNIKALNSFFKSSVTGYDTGCDEVNHILNSINVAKESSLFSREMLMDFVLGRKTADIKKTEFHKDDEFKNVTGANEDTYAKVMEAMLDMGMLDENFNIGEINSQWCDTAEYKRIKSLEEPNILEKHKFCKYLENKKASKQDTLKALEFSNDCADLHPAIADQFFDNLSDDLKMYQEMLNIM